MIRGLILRYRALNKYFDFKILRPLARKQHLVAIGRSENCHPIGGVSSKYIQGMGYSELGKTTVLNEPEPPRHTNTQNRDTRTQNKDTETKFEPHR